MKKKFANFLLRLAIKLSPSLAFEKAPVRRMGIGFHISKRDVKNYRKDNPQYTSHRKALSAMVEDAKWRVAGSIGKGLMEHKAIDFEIKQTLFAADVSGCVYVHAPEEE